MLRLEFLEHDGRDMIRLQGGDREWGVPVGRRQPELEALQYPAQRHLGLDEREVLADAGPLAPAEWKKGRHVARHPCLGDPIGEPLWPELVGVCAPNILVMVEAQEWHHEQHACRVPDTAEVHGLTCLAMDRRQRRVQPQHLVQHHGHDF